MSRRLGCCSELGKFSQFQQRPSKANQFPIDGCATASELRKQIFIPLIEARATAQQGPFIGSVVQQDVADVE
jgi:hypothetical protein